MWSVTFENPDPCAAAGSSVEFRCFYNYSDGQTVRKAAWSKGLMRDGRFTRVDLSHIPTYQNRSEYIGDLRHDCSLALRELDQSDSGHYFFSFSTQSFGPQSRKSVYLTVTGSFYSFLFLEFDRLCLRPDISLTPSLAVVPLHRLESQRATSPSGGGEQREPAVLHLVRARGGALVQRRRANVSD